MKPEQLAEQVEFILMSRGASALSDGQKDILRAAAKKLRRLESDTEKELKKVKEELEHANKNLEEYRNDPAFYY